MTRAKTICLPTLRGEDIILRRQKNVRVGPKKVWSVGFPETRFFFFFLSGILGLPGGTGSSTPKETTYT